MLYRRQEGSSEESAAADSVRLTYEVLPGRAEVVRGGDDEEIKIRSRGDVKLGGEEDARHQAWP